MRTVWKTGLATAASAAVGSIGVDPRGTWYRRLRKPSWQPPSAAFPAVWTPLYVLIAAGSARMIDAEPDARERKRLTALLGANLAVNAGWCWAFFRARRPTTSLAVITALDALNVALLREAARRDATAAAMLAPYVGWTGFATALNGEIARINR